jgi:prolyl oligopeptidase
VERKRENLYFSFTNYITPGSIFSLDTKTGTSVVYEKPRNFNTDTDKSTVAVP